MELTPTIGIIGGHGRMGRWFADFFRQKDFKVLISDIHTELSTIDIAKTCDVIILSVPMDALEQIVKEIAPHIRHGSFLTDICSLKEKQVDLMLKYANCEVTGTHPLFGPAEESMKGRRVALCRGRGDKWHDWWKTLLLSEEALVFELSPQEHDFYMAWVQALNHFILIGLGKSLEEKQIDIKKLRLVATPSFERQMNIVSRLVYQDPRLYSTIQMSNPYTLSVLSSFMENLNKLFDTIKLNDDKEFVEMFKQVQLYAGGLCD